MVYTDPKIEAEANLLKAAFELGQAQRVMEEAEEKYKKALTAVDWLRDRERENRASR